MRSATRNPRTLLLVALVWLAGCGAGTPAVTVTASTTGAHPGDVAPVLAGTTLSGRAFSLQAMRGSVVVVVFWASWCTPCQAEQPAINSLALQEGGGVRFVGVSVDVDRSAALGYMKRFAVPYDSLIDSGQTVVVDYDVAGPPTTFVIDAAGRVASELVGEVNVADLRARIAAARSAR